MVEEIWKAVVGLEGLYEVSSIGRVRGLDRVTADGRLYKGRVRKQSTEKMGYNTVTITNRDGERKTVKVHRLVAEAFIPKSEERNVVNHKNGIKTDNVVDNLEWVTQSENLLHARETGLIPKVFNIGNTNANTKLTEDDVREIRRLHSEGEFSRSQLAEKYGVKYKTIQKVIARESWKHVV